MSRSLKQSLWCGEMADIYTYENAILLNASGRYTNRRARYLAITVSVGDNEEDRYVEAYDEDRRYAYQIDEIDGTPGEDNEISFSSRGTQYRIIPERATENISNPSSDTMKKDQ